MVRTFGTRLCLNTLETGRERNTKSLHKRVKVRRSANVGDDSRVDSALVKSVTFLAGPVGIELEPCDSAEYVAKVVRFVDAWPQSPGQARKCGELKPGDLVLRAQAANEIGTSYDGVVRVLKMTHCIRELSFMPSTSELCYPDPLSIDQIEDIPKTHPSTDNLIEGQEDTSVICLSSSPNAIRSPAHALHDSPWERQTSLSRQSCSRFDVPSPCPVEEKVDQQETILQPDAHSTRFIPSEEQRFTSMYQLMDVRSGLIAKDAEVGYSCVAPVFASSSQERSSIVSNSPTRATAAVEEDTWDDLLSPTRDSKMNLLDELSQVKATLDFHNDNSRDSNEDLDKVYRLDAALHNKFEEKLLLARLEHERTEHDLKKYYSALCLEKESRIRELELINEDLRRNLFERDGIPLCVDDLESEKCCTTVESLKRKGCFKATRSEIDRTVAQLDEINSHVDTQKKLFGRIQFSEFEQDVHDLRIENERLQAKLSSCESELAASKHALESATTTLLEQVEAQTHHYSPTNYANTENGFATAFVENIQHPQDYLPHTNDLFVVDWRSHSLSINNGIHFWGDDLLSLELFHQDVLSLFLEPINRQSNELEAVGCEPEAVDDIHSHAGILPQYTGSLGKSMDGEISINVVARCALPEDICRNREKGAVLPEIENFVSKLEVVTSGKLSFPSKTFDQGFGGLKIQTLSSCTENQEVKPAFIVLERYWPQRRRLLLDIEKRMWASDNTVLKTSLQDAYSDVARLQVAESRMTALLAERDCDMEKLCSDISSLEIERDECLSLVGDMTLQIQGLSADKEEIENAFLKAIQKLDTLRNENKLLMVRSSKALAETRKLELELHDKSRMVNVLETSLETQRAAHERRDLLLKNLFAANAEIVSLRQHCEYQEKEQQQEKDQMLLKMAKMTMCSGEIQRRNSSLRRQLLAKSRDEEEAMNKLCLELDCVRQSVSSDFDVEALNRNRLELQELLERAQAELQSANIEIALLKEALVGARTDVTSENRKCDLRETILPKPHHVDDVHIASLQLTERILERRTIPLTASALRKWHAFACTKRFHRQSIRTSTVLATRLIETRRKICQLRTCVNSNSVQIASKHSECI